MFLAVGPYSPRIHLYIQSPTGHLLNGLYEPGPVAGDTMVSRIRASVLMGYTALLTMASSCMFSTVAC